jgi:hypothetical protein
MEYSLNIKNSEVGIFSPLDEFMVYFDRGMTFVHQRGKIYKVDFSPLPAQSQPKEKPATISGATFSLYFDDGVKELYADENGFLKVR